MWWLFGALAAVPASLFVYSRIVAQKPELYVNRKTKWAQLLNEHVTCIKELYTPTWWCPFGWMQTIVRQALRSRPSLPWERELLPFSDGGQAALDWLHPESERAREDVTTPIVIFLPGMTGSTQDSSYLMHAALEVNKKDWRCVVFNARGLGGCELLTPITYNPSKTDDLAEVVKHVNARYPLAKKMGAGFSLGGMTLGNYIAACPDAESTGLQAGMIMSSPWNALISTRTIERLFNRIVFNQFILKSLLELVLPYKHLYENTKVDWERMLKAKCIRDYDKAFIVPLFGFKDYREYYHKSALYYKIDQMKIPVISLNAEDDCFSEKHTIPVDEVVKTENMAACITAHGGHTAFMQGANPSDIGFLERLLLQVGDVVFYKMN